MKPSLLNLLLILILAFNFSCHEKEVSKKGVSLQHFKKILPSPWQIKVGPLKTPPSQWKGPIAKGLRVEIFNPLPGNKESRDKSYKKLYPKSKKTLIIRPQIIRYFYENLEAGYSFGMMQRVHPAILEGVTDKFVILAPSSVSSEKDFKVPLKIRRLYQNYFGISDDSLKKNAHVIKKAFSPQEIAEVKKNKDQYKGKKAIIFKEDKHGTESLGILTLP
jgi:hypothetical protein